MLSSKACYNIMTYSDLSVITFATLKGRTQNDVITYNDIQELKCIIICHVQRKEHKAARLSVPIHSVALTNINVIFIFYLSILKSHQQLIKQSSFLH